MSADPAGSVRTDAGLIVPETAVEKRSAAMDRQLWKRVTRLFNALLPENLALIVHCRECKAPVLVQEFGAVLVCKCSVRRMV